MHSLSEEKNYFHFRRISWINLYFFILIIVSLLIRLYLSSNLKGYTDDQASFIDWMNIVNKYGLGEVYQHAGINYPPLFLFILGVYKELLSVFHLQVVPGDVLIRIPSILFDMIAIFIYIVASKKVENPFIRVFLVTFLALNPALIYDSSIWGQIDILHSILMVCSILLLATNPFYSGILYSVALLAKFQAIVLAPIFAFFFIKYIWENREVKIFFRYTVGFCIPIAIVSVYFAAYGDFYNMLNHAYLNAVGTFPNITLSAMNIWYYATGAAPTMIDTTIIMPHLTLKRVGLLLLFIAVTFTFIYIFFNRKNITVVLLKAATFLNFSFFMLPTEIHERYSLPALVFVIFVLIFEIKWFGIAFGLTITIFVNLLMASLLGVNPYTGMFVVILNCLIFYSISKLLIKDCNGITHSLIAKKNQETY